jgi:hypothetical protein
MVRPEYDVKLLEERRLVRGFLEGNIPYEIHTGREWTHIKIMKANSPCGKCGRLFY